jgi:hypothetical protein
MRSLPSIHTLTVEVRTHTTHTRDAALRELNRINRWMVAASVLLTGALTDVAAHAFPGKKLEHGAADSAKRAAAHTSRAKAHTGRGASKAGATGSLEPPAQAPRAVAEPSSSAQEVTTTTTQESAPAQESAPTQESAPAHESAAAPEPVVSGGS